MKSNNDKKWTVADVLTNFGKNQAQVQQEKQLKQQLKEALMQNQAQALGQFVPGMEQQMQPMSQDMSLEQSYQQAKQGGIHINPSKKGTFKAQATRMGMGIQEAAAHILANKDEYSSAMVRKANFARNFAKEEGGEIPEYKGGGEMIKRADGSYSQRGLWDNIRANKGSGNEPTREMIEQERQIRKKAMGGMMGPSDCEEGFVWNDTYQTCVPIGQEIIDPQTGENYLKDWYSKRLNVLNNPEYANAIGAENMKDQTKFLNQVVPLANEQLDNYVPTKYVDEIEGDPYAVGEYANYDGQDPVINIKRSSIGNPVSFPATQVHEGSTHANQKAWDKYLMPTQNRMIAENIKPWKTFLNDNTVVDKENKTAVKELESNYDYSTDPQQDNIHSNVHATRYLFKLLPDEVITEDKIKSMIEEGTQKGYLDKSSPNYHDDFYRLYKLSKDKKSLANLFNLLASDSSGVNDDDLQMAKYGGNIGKLRKFF
jgi:hypothetical protein